VKPIALDAFRLQFLGDWKDACNVRQASVKGGIETRRLGKPGKMLSCEADDRQSRWNVQRREGAGGLELPQDRIIDEAMLPELRSAMHDPMPYGGRRWNTGLGEKSPDADDRFPLAWNWYPLAQQRIFLGIPCVDFAFFLADRLGLAGEQHLDS
jgi:hypothetical protein